MTRPGCYQTNVKNVEGWVKVDNHSVNFYWQLFRSVCVAAIQEEVVSLGGNNKVVEIGVISLGTTTSDGNKREVRVEVLGVMDRATGRSGHYLIFFFLLLVKHF